MPAASPPPPLTYLPLPRLLPRLLLAVLAVLTIRASATFTPLSDESLAALRPATDDDFNASTGTLLSPILIPRVPGTDGSLKVLSHFTSFFQNSLPLWHVSTQNSSATTPTSNGAEIPFVNFIATRDPPWAVPGEIGRLVLVAHYDSKLTPVGFLGATDSAVPCAVLLHTAAAIDQALTNKWAAMKDADDDLKADERGVMILLLDGEEAFHQWTDEDSLYGARALAEHWESSFNPAASSRHTELAAIDLFVLLDLLGSAGPRIPSYFRTTHWAYAAFREVEQRMRESGTFESKDSKDWFYEPKDKEQFYSHLQVLDDHIPFLHRGVEILHLIPNPFPSVWHQMKDDGEHLDPGAVRDWARLTAAWTAGYLGLDGWVEGVVEEEQEAKEAQNGRRKVKRGVKTEL